MIVEFTREMLLRRLKEEYNDEKTTLFSPLIEDICKQENWINALNVLKKGFEKIKDSFMAQTLARWIELSKNRCVNELKLSFLLSNICCKTALANAGCAILICIPLAVSFCSMIRNIFKIFDVIFTVD
jgi:hypothetical protein